MTASFSAWSWAVTPQSVVLFVFDVNIPVFASFK